MKLEKTASIQLWTIQRILYHRQIFTLSKKNRPLQKGGRGNLQRSVEREDLVDTKTFRHYWLAEKFEEAGESELGVFTS